ncbi:response regulator [Mongoliimonas terrestris]|uniref:response regulator n=1 Tax=Mongoliimonas terrestris TaxID=1709001 RepID=UPI000B31CC7C|nr:response regulator [Mongoliimonas terrestris]
MNTFTKAVQDNGRPVEDYGVTERGSPRPAPPLATVLVVDDDPLVRTVTAAMLEHHGFAVLEAGNGRDALALMGRGEGRGESVDLLIVDFEMPGMNGIAVAEAIGRTRPDLPVIFLTGFGHRAELNGVHPGSIVEKPVSDGDLAARVHAALAVRPDV